MEYWRCTSSSSIGICAKFLFRSTNLVSFFHAPKIKGAAYIRGRLILGQIRYIVERTPGCQTVNYMVSWISLLPTLAGKPLHLPEYMFATQTWLGGCLHEFQ